jgi:hypothetical protein
MRLLRHTTRFYPFGSLVRLSFIHFAHWSVFYRIPPGDPKGQRLPHPYLVFQSNFNRGWREYVEAFCYVIPTGVRLNWRGAYGFPSPKPVGPFLEYVDKRFTKSIHHYSAYPDASTRMVISALDARRRFDEFAEEGFEPPTRFRRTRAAPPRVRALGGRPREAVDTISVLCPIIEGRERELKDLLESLPTGDESPLAKLTGTHMARWSIVAPISFKRNDLKIDSTSYLLFTSWYAGDRPVYVREMRSHLGELADEIWNKCVAYPGRRDLSQFSAYLTRHSIRPHLAFGGYPDSVTDVRASLELRDELAPVVKKESGSDTAALERAWRRARRRPLFR